MHRSLSLVLSRLLNGALKIDIGVSRFARFNLPAKAAGERGHDLPRHRRAKIYSGGHLLGGVMGEPQPGRCEDGDKDADHQVQVQGE